MLDALVIVFGFMVIGYITQNKKDSTRSLSNLCLYFFIPILIFQSIIKSTISFNSVLTVVSHFFITTFLTYFILLFGLGRLLGWKGESLKWNSLSSTLANVGYFGLAVVKFGIGNHAVPYAIAVALGFNLYMAFFGYSQVNGKSSIENSLRSIYRNPYLLAVILAVLWKYSGFNLIKPVDSFLDLVVQATLPITLLLTGAEFRQNSFRFIYFKEALKISVIKLLLPVAIAWPLANLLSNDPIERSVMILMFGMPTSLNLLLLAKNKNVNSSVITLSIMLTTILSPITLIGLIKLLSIT